MKTYLAGTNPLAGVLDTVDAKVGTIIEGTTRRHHARRLARLSQTHALRGEGQGWASRGAIPRDGKRVVGFFAGVSALPAIAAAVRAARSSVHVAGWVITPSFAVEREPNVVTLR